jgi:2-succinyl-5-enolpyruvyl-6-hydroxy-3-cyclohexene-1-carboxylate synthase
MNPSTAFGLVLADELARCGLREVVVAPGSRSTPLAIAFWELDRAGRVRLHVRVDERSAAFTALGLAKASRRPVAVLCTSGTAAANFHPAVIEADESAVPLLVLTADRPPELRGTGANQTVDQVKLYGSAVRWYAESGVPERRAGMAGYWRSLACRAWAHAAGAPGTLPGPVHLNLPFRDPLVPDALPTALIPDNSNKRAGAQTADALTAGTLTAGAMTAGAMTAGTLTAGGLAVDALLADADWPDALAGRPAGAPWTRIADGGSAAAPLELPWAERGVVVCGDGDYDAGALVALAERAGWPVLAEPSSGARLGPNALTGYQHLLASSLFMAEYRPDVIVSAGRPGLTRAQSALLGLARAAAGEQAGAAAAPAVRHVVIASGPGLWADPQRAATDVATAVRLSGAPAAVPGRWLGAWRRADAAATRAAGALLDAWHAGPAADEDGVPAAQPADEDAQAAARPAGEDGPAAAQPADEDAQAAARPAGEEGPAAARPAARGGLSEPDIARELVAALPEHALLWCGNSLSVRDIDLVLPPRADTRVIASRGASGIDGTFSTAAGAALAHAALRPGAVAFALIGDLSLLHDAAGLVIGPGEPRPDLCVVVVNNDGGGIFAGLEPAAFTGPFERVFCTPHGASIEHLAAAFGIPYTLAERPGDLAKALAAVAPGAGPQVIEARTARAWNAQLRTAIRAAAVRAAEDTLAPGA